MGLLPSQIKLLLMLHLRFQFEGPVVTLGNQDIYASYRDLQGFFAQVDCPWVAPREIRGHTSWNLATVFPERAPEFVHARTLFEMMGIDGYVDIDLGEQDQPEVRHDLNVPVAPELCDRFGLTLDGGTLEHIFDVGVALRSMARMTRVGGWVFHVNPIAFINHGFYNFDPMLFYDFYELNGFDSPKCYVVQVDTNDVFAPCPWFQYSYGQSFGHVLEPGKVPVACFAARKRESVPVIRPPVQGALTPDFPARMRASATADQADGPLPATSV
jgi:hypothetical protein